MFPAALVGQPHRGSYICADWELRVTRRCLDSDLGFPPDSDFESVLGHDIIKAFTGERFDRTTGTRTVSRLGDRRSVWVLARGHDHRGGTWHHANLQVVWLLAYARHRSGAPDDFFPYCRELATNGDLFPTQADYEGLLRDRGTRFAYAIRIEAPLVLQKARQERTEQRVMFGGKCGACVALEIADEIEAATVAFKVDTLDIDHVAIILRAFYGEDAAWDLTDRMPSRELEPGEVAFTTVVEGGGG